MTQLAEEKGVLMSNLPRLELSLPEGLPWLASLRKHAMNRFEQLGFPTMKQEEYRFTNFAPIARTAFVAPDNDLEAAVAAVDLIQSSSFGADALVELVFVNGNFAPRFSKLGKLPRGATIRPLAQALQNDGAMLERNLGRHAGWQENPFTALNTASFTDGALIHLAPNTVIDGPVHVLFVTTTGSAPTVSQPRVLIVADDNSELTVVNSFVGGSGLHWTNAVTEMVLGKDCRVNHNRIDLGSEEAFRTTAMHVTVGRGSQFISHYAAVGGRLTRNNLNVVMAGEGADATLNGLVILRGSEHCDNHTLLDHAAPRCPSHELFKHVLSGSSSCVFKGKILVRQIAQKTDSKQTSKSLLLSDDARMDSQPALEIYADDVKCTHGSTTGPVDEEMVFYLRSRGVGLEAARHLLSYAFAADVTRRIKVEPVRRRVEDFMAAQHNLPRDLRITDLGEHDEKAR